MNNQTHRKSVRERLCKYLSRYSSGCGGVLIVGKRTPSDPMKSVYRYQSPSDFFACQFARDLWLWRVIRKRRPKTIRVMAEERQLSCVARLLRIIAYKQTANVTCVASVFRLKALRTNDGCHMCSALVSHHGFTNGECYTCSSLVSYHGFKNDKSYK